MGFMKDAKEEGTLGHILRMWKRERRAMRKKEAWANWGKKWRNRNRKICTSTI